MIHDFKILQMKKTDLSEVTEIENASFKNTWSAESFLRELSLPFSYSFVAKNNEKIVGYICFWRIEKEGHIMNLAVHPEYRRKGVGKKLMDYILNFSKDLGIERFFLEVRESNRSALLFYDFFKFIKIGLRKRYYGDEDAIVMMREI